MLLGVTESLGRREKLGMVLPPQPEQLGRSRNRHNGDGTAAKFLADVGPLAAIRPSTFSHDGNLNLTARSPTAIENHLSVRVVREPIQQIIVQCPMLQRHDE
jgi:hypothetical protein